MIRAALGLAATLLAALGALGCDDRCCVTDERPIPLQRGPAGELLVGIATPEGPALAVVDTSSPVTFWLDPRPADPPRLRRRDLRLLGPAAAGAPPPLRAVLADVLAAEMTLSPLRGGEQTVQPRAVLGADVLSGFSLEIGFGPPELVLWRRQPATDAFLSGAGYAVLHAERVGSAEFESLDPPDWLGQREPHRSGRTRLVLRACAAPAPFDREAPPPARCCRGDDRRLASGTDLALLLGTGVGPTLLSRSAWTRLAAAPGAAQAVSMGRRPLHLALSAQPIDAEWFVLPRLALVDREARPDEDPGPCVELARARRIEQVELTQVRAQPGAATCALPCDWDPRMNRRAQNSAAYLELDGGIEVAVVEDDVGFLQTLRAHVRPEGPEIDGVLGAATLDGARVEIDNAENPARALFSCERGSEARCRAAGRCPRLPGRGQARACFGLPAHELPSVCENPKNTCG
jgi:hypothetical protein